MRTNLATVPVTVAISLVVPAATEDTRSLAKPGQRRWWLQGPKPDGDRDPWWTIGTHVATEPTRIDVELVPGGKYVLGTGITTRIRFVCPLVPCTLGVDPSTGTARPVESAPAPVVVGGTGDEAPAFHVRYAPIGSMARGITYTTARAASDDLGRMVGAGTVDPADVASGRIVVTRGKWPVAGYPPPAPPIVVETVAALAPVPTEPGPTTYDAVRQASDAATNDGHLSPWEADADGLGYTHPDTGSSVRRGPSDARRWVADGAGFRTLGDAQEHALLVAARGLAAQQAAAEINASADLGFVAPPPAVTVGETRNRRAFREQPYVRDALSTVSIEIAGEVRENRYCRLTDVKMDPAGQVTWFDGSSALGMERIGLGELVTLRNQRSGTLPRARALMELLPPSVRADVWNAQNTTDAAADDDAVLRTRLRGNKRSVFAAVTPGYTALDADAICDITRDALTQVPGGNDARGSVHYDPATTQLSIDVVFGGDLKVRAQTNPNDRHVGGVRITSADNGTGAIVVTTLVWRLLCSNGMMGFGPGTSERIVHRGNRDTMVRRLAEAIVGVSAQASAVVDRFVALREQSIAQYVDDRFGDTVSQVRAIMRELVGVKRADDSTDPIVVPSALRNMAPMDVEGIDRDVMVEQLLQAWHREPGDSMADIVNAVTRLHTERVPVPVLRMAESYAGELAYNLTNQPTPFHA